MTYLFFPIIGNQVKMELTKYSDISKKEYKFLGNKEEIFVILWIFYSKEYKDEVKI